MATKFSYTAVSEINLVSIIHNLVPPPRVAGPGLLLVVRARVEPADLPRDVFRALFRALFPLLEDDARVVVELHDLGDFLGAPRR